MRPILGPTVVDPPTPVEEEMERAGRRRWKIAVAVLLAIGLLLARPRSAR
jgi:hypothetical protein